jgi:hypothetical protein
MFPSSIQSSSSSSSSAIQKRSPDSEGTSLHPNAAVDEVFVGWVPPKNVDETSTSKPAKGVPRLAHKKSRTGCQRCRQRRVKASQAFPIRFPLATILGQSRDGLVLFPLLSFLVLRSFSWNCLYIKLPSFGSSLYRSRDMDRFV